MTIPLNDTQVDALATLAKLGGEKRAVLNEYLSSSAPSIDLEPIVSGVAERLGVTEDKLESSLVTIVAIKAHSRRNEIPVFQAAQEAIDSFAPHYEGEGPEEVEELHKFILELLEAGHPFAKTAKALSLHWDHSELFNEVRILTDLRPLFDSDFGDELEQPSCYALTHTLRLSYLSRERENMESRFIVMTENDLLRLQENISRALRKHAELKAGFESGMIVS